MTESPRLLAAKSLLRIVKDGAYSNIQLFSGGIRHKNDADKALFEAIVKHAVERRNTLDYILSLLAPKKPDIFVRCVLHTGLAQLFYMDKIPERALCDESVKAAKALAGEKRAAFVNAVLRNACRRKEELRKAVSVSKDDVKYSMDQSICRLIRNAYPEEAEQIFCRSFTKPKLCLRVNTLINTAAALCDFLRENGIEPQVRGRTVFVSEKQEKALSFIDSGRFFVQGAPSQNAVRLLGARPGAKIIDVCAAPGGKILGTAIDMQNKGAALAFDIHENKLSLVEKAAARLQISILQTAVFDSRRHNKPHEKTADAVICDVPCSALGVLASRPEIRYKDITRLDDLYKTQEEILASSAKYVKPGGVLVYSTCTINPEENEKRVAAFLLENKHFKVAAEERTLFTDGAFEGFYAAKLVYKP